MVSENIESFWQNICEEAHLASAEEPTLSSFYHATILNHSSFVQAISFHLGNKLSTQAVPAMQWCELFETCLQADSNISESMRLDAEAYRDRDPACDKLSLPFLYFKGYHALQAYRLSHWLWQQGRRVLALYLQNQISQTFSVDIHPAATIGSGIMIDHATGVVIGETVVIENNVSMLHAVTLGGTGCTQGDRHPKIRCGVLISAGAKILGNIEVGEGAKVGAGSVVLNSVAAHTTVAGVPAKMVGVPKVTLPALDMDHQLLGDT